jgi:3-oxoacyl-[acyl-carrier protein] reductase
VALVTGASRNIGAAVAERLGEEGAIVAVNYRAEGSARDARSVVESIQAAGGIAKAFRADVADEEQVTQMVAEITESLGPPLVLVNNAAADVAFDGPWLATATDGWDHVMRTNLTGAFICARAVYPGMAAAGGGQIVNMSSIRALSGKPGALHYTTSKAGLIGFTRGLARELGAENINVNAIVVGAIETPNERVYGTPEEVDPLVLAGQSVKRRGVPSDIAAATVFLASADASFITGQCIVVDGGWAVP